MKSLHRIVKDTRLASRISVLFSSSVTSNCAFLCRKQTSSWIKQGLESHRDTTHTFCSLRGNREGGWGRAGMGWAAGPHPVQTGAAALQTMQLCWTCSCSSPLGFHGSRTFLRRCSGPHQRSCLSNWYFSTVFPHMKWKQYQPTGHEWFDVKAAAQAAKRKFCLCSAARVNPPRFMIWS